MARSAHPKTLIQQLGGLACLAITRDVELRRGCLRWRADVQPSPLSLTYTLSLTYRGGSRPPSVFILDPPLRREQVKGLPHVYPEDELCLCYPSEWDEGKLISRTVVPWAAEWLLHFELWKQTEEWHGGGHEPAVLPEGK